MNDEKLVNAYLTAGANLRTDSIPEDGGGNIRPSTEDDEPALPPRVSYKQLQRLTRAEQVAYARQRGHA